MHLCNCQPLSDTRTGCWSSCRSLPSCSSGSPWHKLQNRGLVEETEDFVEVVAQPNWQITAKEADLCATIKEDCAAKGCCKTTGYKCRLGAKITFDTKENTSYELELLKMQYAKKDSLFACNAYAVYGDVAEDLGGFPVQKGHGCGQ